MIDYSYIGNMVHNMFGVTVRVYHDGMLIFSRSNSDISKELLSEHEKVYLSFTARASSYVTPELYFYGVLNHDDLRFVVGPSSLVPDKQPQDDDREKRAKPAFVPIEKAMQFLCMLNFFLNNEKLSASDIVRYDSYDATVAQHIRTGKAELNDVLSRKQFDELYDTEQKMVRVIRTGDTGALAEMKDEILRTGSDIVKARRYFVIISSVAVRSAVKGGMDTFDAFTWNKKFVNRCDELNDVDDIAALKYKMIHFYTNEVQKIRMGNSPSKLVIDAASYIREHMSEPIKTDQIAEALYLSRSHLSREFRLESGMTLSDFIMLEKSEEAKRLLRYTEKPISDISTELGFSSQSHLIRIFRKYEGMTPGEYRAKYI
ncbi:MAG: AraC family transcriptional regulator [Oscillospiraceae bacterium]|nr:AraC family transcriptional regulator [Oscillospiraceae bacterium]